MTVRLALRLIGSALGIAGLMTLGFMVSWWAALGAFLMLFGSNIERDA